MDIWIWTAIVVIAIIIEFASPDLVSIWFGAGALVSLGMAAFIDNWTIEILTFVIVSTLLLIFLRKIVKRYLDKGTIPTNADKMVGASTTLLTDITADNNGSVRIGDVTWQCTTEDSSSINAGSTIEIIEIKGNKLIIKEKK